MMDMESVELSGNRFVLHRFDRASTASLILQSMDNWQVDNFNDIEFDLALQNPEYTAEQYADVVRMNSVIHGIN